MIRAGVLLPLLAGGEETSEHRFVITTAAVVRAQVEDQAGHVTQFRERRVHLLGQSTRALAQRDVAESARELAEGVAFAELLEILRWKQCPHVARITARLVARQRDLLLPLLAAIDLDRERRAVRRAETPVTRRVARRMNGRESGRVGQLARFCVDPLERLLAVDRDHFGARVDPTRRRRTESDLHEHLLVLLAQREPDAVLSRLLGQLHLHVLELRVSVLQSRDKPRAQLHVIGLGLDLLRRRGELRAHRFPVDALRREERSRLLLELVEQERDVFLARRFFDRDVRARRRQRNEYAERECTCEPGEVSPHHARHRSVDESRRRRIKELTAGE
jgi:hypothetical protein